MNVNKTSLIKIILNHAPVIVLTMLSAIPVFYSWGRLNIGGDMIIPFDSVSLHKYLYQWLDVQNGQYFSINYYPLYFFYKVTGLFNLSVYHVSSIFLFLLSFVSGVGVLKLARLFVGKKEDKNNYLILFPVIFYMLSPALFNSWHYIFIYSFIPLFFYFIINIIKKNNFEVKDVVFLNVVLFFLSIDLPNPKYLFHIFLISAMVFFISFFLKIVSRKFFTGSYTKIIILFLSITYFTLPLFYFAKNYTSEDYNTKIRAGYKDTGVFMDEGSTTVDKMVRIHSDGLVINTPEQKKYTSSKVISFLSFTFIVVITWLLIRKKNSLKEERYKVLFLFLVIIYLFFAVGPNPPFGFLYKFAVSKFSLLAFLRTTAGAVFFLSLFYSLLLFFFLNDLSGKFRRNVFLFLLLSLIIVSYPIVNGEFYKNVNAVNKFTNRNDFGYKIPAEYLKIKVSLNDSKIDGKIFFPNSRLSYFNTDWGYSGPMFYNFLYQNTPIYEDGIYSLVQLHSAYYLLEDNSVVDEFTDKKNFNSDNFEEIKRDNFITLKKISKNIFLPHFYTPQKNIISNGKIKELLEIVLDENYDIRSAVFLENQNKEKKGTLNNLDDEITDEQKLEFKKINPTKYRVRVHSASGKFPLVFSESFHKGWKAYLAKPKNSQFLIPDSQLLSKYKILDGNEEDQASVDELKEFIEKGWVTDIGDGKEKEIKHQKWNSDKQKEEFDYAEKYSIDFISKNFQGTIQNDNLPSGKFYETWLPMKEERRKKKEESIGDRVSNLFQSKNVLELPEENHLMANGYANSWVIDVDEVCENNNFCRKNPDGTYDLEIIAEFWPQRLFYIGLGISGMTLLGCLVYLTYDWGKRKKIGMEHRT